MTEKTVLDLYRCDFENPKEEHYFHYTLDGHTTTSTEEFFSNTAGLAVGLEKLGVGRGDRVMLLTDNRPEWHMVDLATVDLGAADVPVYGTLTPSKIAYQVKDSGSKIAIAENAEQMAKFLQIRDECPTLEHVIQIDGPCAAGVLPLAEVIDTGRSGESEDLFWQRAERVAAEDLLTLIYTSGTTGNPKGVALTHENLVQNVLPSAERAAVDRDDFCLEFLPLCHVFERMLGYLYMYKGVTKAYCSVYHVGDLVATIKPTVFASVPRIYEKVYDKVNDKVNNSPAVRRALFNWALGVGRKAYPERLAGGDPGGISYRLADALVLSKVREALGGRLRFCVSGGAPLPLFINEFFHSVGIRILEGYGLTETSPVISVNGFSGGETRLGTVGRAISNVDAKIAEDGELCVKGPSIMKEYWNLPDKTAEVFDADGYFLTGDIAEIDSEGFIRITDRKKDLIVTAGGKNIAPQPIEAELKRSPLVDNAVIIGDRRPYLVVLLSPNTEAVEQWAENEGVTYSSIGEVTSNPKLAEAFAEVVENTNNGLASYEQIKKHAILPLMLSIEDGTLTPTLKVKRRVVEKEYLDLIESLYEG
ncbi:MAG: long-chain fatty acid--CoA ligase [Acidobacteria bacterium]|jgi:long-chain acyl-CoA synthetase|nr:long-chain fatty acid--CoA ligase [Acidobacteriota bacterium]